MREILLGIMTVLAGLLVGLMLALFFLTDVVLLKCVSLVIGIALGALFVVFLIAINKPRE